MQDKEKTVLPDAERINERESRPVEQKSEAVIGQPEVAAAPATEEQRPVSQVDTNAMDVDQRPAHQSAPRAPRARTHRPKHDNYSRSSGHSSSSAPNNNGRSHQENWDKDNRSNQPRRYDQQKEQRPYDRSFEREVRDLKQLPLEEMTISELNQYGRRFGIVGAGLMRKDALIEKIKYVEAHPELEMEVKGVLEKLPDGFGFLRSAAYDYVSGPDDIYVSPSQIRRFGLRTGDTVTGVIRKPKEGEKYFALLKVTDVNGFDPLRMIDRPLFERLIPLHPDQKFLLEYDPTAISTRLMDIFTPVGKGQRGLLVAPPKVGKTMLLKEMAQAILNNHPEAQLIVLLVDERPEEVSDMKRQVKGSSAEVISSTFDEPAERHVQVAELSIRKSKTLGRIWQ